MSIEELESHPIESEKEALADQSLPPPGKDKTDAAAEVNELGLSLKAQEAFTYFLNLAMTTLHSWDLMDAQQYTDFKTVAGKVREKYEADQALPSGEKFTLVQKLLELVSQRRSEIVSQIVANYVAGHESAKENELKIYEDATFIIAEFRRHGFTELEMLEKVREYFDLIEKPLSPHYRLLHDIWASRPPKPKSAGSAILSY